MDAESDGTHALPPHSHRIHPHVPKRRPVLAIWNNCGLCLLSLSFRPQIQALGRNPAILLETERV